MGNPHLRLVVLFVVRVFSAAIPGFWEYNCVFLLSYNLAPATRGKRLVWNQRRQLEAVTDTTPLADSSIRPST